MRLIKKIFISITFLLLIQNHHTFAQTYINYDYTNIRLSESNGESNNLTVHYKFPGMNSTQCTTKSSFRGIKISNKISIQTVKDKSITFQITEIFRKRKKNSDDCNYNNKFSVIDGDGDHHYGANFSNNIRLNNAIINKSFPLNNYSIFHTGGNGRRYIIDGNIVFKLPTISKNYLKINYKKPQACGQSNTTEFCAGGDIVFEETGMASFFDRTFNQTASTASKKKTKVNIEYNFLNDTYKGTVNGYTLRTQYGSDASSISEFGFYYTKEECTKQIPTGNSGPVTFSCVDKTKLKDLPKWRTLSFTDGFVSGEIKTIPITSLPNFKQFVQNGQVEVQFRYNYSNDNSNGGIAQTTNTVNSTPIIIRPNAPDFKSINNQPIKNGETLKLSPICLIEGTPIPLTIGLDINSLNNNTNNRILDDDLVKFFIKIKSDNNLTCNPQDESIASPQNQESLKNVWYELKQGANINSFTLRDFLNNKTKSFDIKNQVSFFFQNIAKTPLTNLENLSLDLIVQNSSGNGVCTNKILLEIPIRKKPEIKLTNNALSLSCYNSDVPFSFTSNQILTPSQIIFKFEGKKINQSEIQNLSIQPNPRNNTLVNINGSIKYSAERVKNESYQIDVIDDCNRISSNTIIVKTRPKNVDATKPTVEVQCNALSTDLNKIIASININGIEGGLAPTTYNLQAIHKTDKNKSSAIITTDQKNTIIPIQYPGTYDVQLTDSKNTCNTKIIAQNLLIEKLPALSIQLNPVSVLKYECHNQPEGTVSFVIPNPNEDIQYTLTNTSSNKIIETGEVSKIGTPLEFNNLPASQYQLLIDRGIINCANIKTYDFTITEPNEIKVSHKIQRPSCFGEKDATISFEFSGGSFNEVYEASLTSQSTTKVITNSNITTGKTTFSKLTSGNYIVKVVTQDKSGVNCKTTFTEAIQIRPILKVAAELNTPDLSCLNPENSFFSINNIKSDLNTVNILIEKEGNPITELKDYTQTSFKTEALEPGKYNVIISDSKRPDCFPIKEKFEIESLTPLDFKITDTKNITCFAGLDGAFTLQSKNKKSSFKIYRDKKLINTIKTQPNKKYKIDNQIAGDYEIQLVRDFNPCDELNTQSFTLTQPNPFEVKEKITNLTCEDLKNGAIEVEIKGGTPPYKLTWFQNNQTDPFKKGGIELATIRNLEASEYTLLVEDNVACKNKLLKYVVTQPKMVRADIQIVATGCEEPLDAALVINELNGGDNLFDITITKNGELLQSFEKYNKKELTIDKLLPANYELTISDSNRPSCQTIVYPFDINQLLPLKITNQKINNIQCFGETNGNASFEMNGSNSYYYKLFKNELLFKEDITTSNKVSFFDLEKGNYKFSIFRSKTCDTFDEKTFDIVEPSPIELEINKINISTSGLTNGEIKLNVKGGWGSYNINWFKNGNKFEVENPYELKALETATYQTIIIDQEGCKIKSKKIEILEPEPLVFLNIEEFDKKCGLEQFQVKLDPEVEGGWPPYNFEINRNNSEWKPVNFEDFLNAGTLQFRVIDNRKNITQYDQPIVYTPNTGILDFNWKAKEFNGYNIACFGDSTGEITMTPEGGAGSYTFKIDTQDWTENGTFSNLSSGKHQLSIRDINGCTVTKEINFSTASEFKYENVKIKDVKCFGDFSGEISFNTIGGTSPFQFKIEDLPYQNEPIFEALTAGTYTLTTLDANQCEHITSVTIKSLNPPIELNESVSQVSCPGEATGSIILSPQGGKLPYSFKWSDGAQTQNRTDLPIGTYEVTLQDAEGCLSIKTFEITEPQIVLLPEDKILCKDAVITLDATHPDALSYQWKYNNKNITTEAKSTFENPGKYEVFVSLNTGCIISDDFNFSHSDVVFDADFLMATYNIKGDTIQLVESSTQQPDEVKWTIDPALQTGVDEFNQPWIIAPKEGVFKVELEAFLNGCSSLTSKLISFSEDQSEPEFVNETFFEKKELESAKVMPNPSNGIFEIEIKQSSELPIEINIISNDKRMVFETKSDPNKIVNQKVNISDQPSGVYLIILKTVTYQKAIRIILDK